MIGLTQRAASYALFFAHYQACSSKHHLHSCGTIQVTLSLNYPHVNPYTNTVGNQIPTDMQTELEAT